MSARLAAKFFVLRHNLYKGATAAFYGVMVAAIIAVIVVVVFAIGQKILAAFNLVDGEL